LTDSAVAALSYDSSKGTTMVRCSVLALILPALLAGCGSSLAPVHGKVIAHGQPVTAGSVMFVPKAKEADSASAGRPAVGAPDETGAFQLSTFAKNDGALIGTHVVTFAAPTPPVTVDATLHEKQRQLYEKFGKCKLRPGYEVEVKPGSNEIVLDVTPMESGSPPQ
jgi:hypothetical protein